MSSVRGAVEELDSDAKLTRRQRRMVIRMAMKGLRPWRRIAIVAAVVILAATIARLAGPKLIAWGIDSGIAQGGDGLSVVTWAAILWIAASVAGYFLTRSQIWLVSYIGEQYLRDLRVRVFSHIESLDIDFFSRERSGRLVSRMTSDVESLQHFVSQGLIILISSVLTFFLTLGVLFTMSVQLTMVTLAVLPPLVVASIVFRSYANPAYLRVRERIAGVLNRLQENLTGIRVVQAFGREEIDAGAFELDNESHYKAQVRTARISAIYFPVVEFVGLAGGAIVLGAGAALASDGAIGFGIVIAFVFYLSNLFDPVQQVTQLYNDFQAATAALHKLHTLLDVKPKIVERPGAVALKDGPGRLRIERASFAYEVGRPVIRDVTLDIEPGTRLAVVGQTGAGKSTLVKLMTRFYDPNSGAISIDCVDLRDATNDSLRKMIGFVPQEGHVFSGTVWENIAYGRKGASRDDAVIACEQLGIMDLIRSLPEGIDTAVDEKGGRLSAGQRQLIALARARLADPRILIMDEATSALDPATAAAIEEAIPALMRGRTSVIIAHRLATAVRSDLIVLMEAGKIAEIGEHEDLIRRNGPYAELYRQWTGVS